MESLSCSLTPLSTHAALKMKPSVDVLGQTCPSRAISLEDLPIEIKVMILSYSSHLSSLSSIVHASPAYHQAYCGAREEILHAMTIHTLQEHDIGLLDPWTAVHALQPGNHTACRLEFIKESLERYARGCMEGSRRRRRRLAPEDSLAILDLHKKFSVLISNYCKDKFSRNPLTGSPDNDALPPSQLELHRLHRALWRYEIYSKFFGPLSMRGIAPRDHAFSEDEIAYNFFGLFPIHEVEEIACLQKYTRDYYYSMTARRHWYSLSRKEDQLVASGPEKLHEVMTAASDFECNVRMAEGVKREWVYVTMRCALDAYERDIGLRSSQWKERYANLHNDRTPTTSWLWASSRGVQNTDFRLRRWGYVFWDRERLDHWAITKDNMVNWPRLACVMYAH